MADTLDPLAPSVNTSPTAVGLMRKLRMRFGRASPISGSSGEGIDCF